MSWEALHVAATDRSSGSAAVAANAANAFVEIATTLSEDAIVDAARTLAQGQPIMAACLRLCDAVLRGLSEDGPVGARRASEAFAQRLAAERTALTEHLKRKLPTEGTVLTVSASSTVVAALRQATGLRVLCAVSEPGGEGHRLVETLTASGVEATPILDGAIAQQSTRADVIVFGADVIGPGAILNKTGTLAAALGARSNGRQCLCAAGTSKLVGEATWPTLASASESLMVDGVSVFEEVPAALVSTFVTEEGAVSPRSLRRAARSVKLHPSIAEWLG
jgi:translation initiation factor 2B subunit (eIF-2B alpha/beta/delta family)